jgi:hypothetical protein
MTSTSKRFSKRERDSYARGGCLRTAVKTALVADPKRVIWWGGLLGALVAWAFSGADVYAHHWALDPASELLIVVGAVLVALPRIENLRATIPLPGQEGFEVSINDFEQAVKAADEATALATGAGDTAEEAAKLYESWLRELDALFDGLERVPFDRGAYVRAVFRFINTRLEDLSTWVGAAFEEVRAALWWWSDADGGARIVAAPRIHDSETLGYVFRPGVGILGRVLVDGEAENLADASLDIAWQRIAKSAPRYHGLLCLPIVVRGRVAGVLTVDRTRPEAFADDSVRFARQIVALIKLAALHTTARANVFSLPLPQDEVRARPTPDSQ